MIAGRDSGDQALAGIRGPHPARPLGAVEREGEARYLFAPEYPIELLAQPFGPLSRQRRLVVQAQRIRHPDGGVPRSIDITLYFAERDRSHGLAAVIVEDGIVAILPSL